MQNAGIGALGLPWRYIAFDVLPGELSAAVAGAKAMRFVGLNLTIPHKMAAADLVDALDESARSIGAVNTIRFEARDGAGVWQPMAKFDELPDTGVRGVGFNTDADAIARVLQEDLGLRLPGIVALLLGAGGAGRTAALRMACGGAGELWLVNRTVEKADALAREIRRTFPKVPARTGYPPAGVDVVINATSLGLQRGDPLPFDSARFDLRRARAVFDMVYRPAETGFLRAGREAGCRVTNGLSMLLYQGASALELWAGRPAPLEAMRRALEAEVYAE